MPWPKDTSLLASPLNSITPAVTRSPDIVKSASKSIIKSPDIRIVVPSWDWDPLIVFEIIFVNFIFVRVSLDAAKCNGFLLVSSEAPSF